MEGFLSHLLRLASLGRLCELYYTRCGRWPRDEGELRKFMTANPDEAQQLSFDLGLYDSISFVADKDGNLRVKVGLTKDHLKWQDFSVGRFQCTTEIELSPPDAEAVSLPSANF